MKGLVGGPLLVGGLGPRPPGPPLKSGPDYTNFLKIFLAFHARSIAFYKISVLEIKNLGMQRDFLSPVVGSIFSIFSVLSSLIASKFQTARKHT